jgi:uncharacterized membrane protein
MRFIFLIAVLFLLSTTVVHATYYADVVLDVQPDGSVIISGVANHPQLQEGTTNEFTSKNKEYWLLNVTLEESFDEYVVTILLPENANLNYVSSRSPRIGSQDDRVTITRVGSNSTVEIVAQYTVEPKRNKTLGTIVIAAVLLMLIIVLSAFAAKRTKSKQAKKHVHEQKTDVPRPKIYEGLPIRQQEIIALLEHAGGNLTQKQIEDNMHIPKSSVSRNLDALQKRGIIKKESYGMTNIISLLK